MSPPWNLSIVLEQPLYFTMKGEKSREKEKSEKSLEKEEAATMHAFNTVA